MIDGFTPLWRTPTRAEAVDLLRTCRAWTDARVALLAPEERERPTPLGDGTWSVKDLLGHLATHEQRALILLGARAPAGDELSTFPDVAAFNEHHRQERSAWSLEQVERDYATTRDELVEAILAADDEQWLEKIPAGKGRSARGLVLAKALNGDKYGYFAHDLAHGRGLLAAVAAVEAQRAPDLPA